MASENTKAYATSVPTLRRRINTARGLRPAAVVIRGAQWLDVFSGAWRSGDVAIDDGLIIGVGESYDALTEMDATGLFLVPGFIDSHVHIESSMMTPDRFAEAVLPKGTTAVIWDPHEIANVKGLAGIRWALEVAETVALDIFVMIPSCVPSTSPALKLENSGAVLNADVLREFSPPVHRSTLGLAEMMNWPGLLSGDEEILQKLLDFQMGPRDGHCPGLSGKDLNAYAACGIHSCHESTTLAEGREKLSKGIHVLIREGSCAKDADVLLPLLTQRSSPSVAFCSDDRNPLDIEDAGHIDCLVNKALQADHDPVEVFRSASWSASLMYGLKNRGAVAPGYLADLVLLRPAANGSWVSGCTIIETLRRGKPASEWFETPCSPPANPFPGKNLNLGISQVKDHDLKITTLANGAVNCRVLGVRPGQIVTDRLAVKMEAHGGEVLADIQRDILKIAVFERHVGSRHKGVALVQGFKIHRGAIATSINHDCHNVIATGSSDELIAKAVNELCRIDGGIIVVSDDGQIESLPLPIGGLMTSEPPARVSQSLRRLKDLAKKIGCELEEPFLQLSFLALPVIPTLKVTDQGLIDGESFQVVSVVI